MFDYLIGMSFDEVIADLEARGKDYDFGESSYEECVAHKSYALYIGGFWNDIHFDLDFDDDGRVISVELWDEGWE